MGWHSWEKWLAFQSIKFILGIFWCEWEVAAQNYVILELKVLYIDYWMIIGQHEYKHPPNMLGQFMREFHHEEEMPRKDDGVWDTIKRQEDLTIFNLWKRIYQGVKISLIVGVAGWSIKVGPKKIFTNREHLNPLYFAHYTGYFSKDSDIILPMASSLESAGISFMIKSCAATARQPILAILFPMQLVEQ